MNAGKPWDIVERTFLFALNIIAFCEAYERSGGVRRLAWQLLDSGTSIGANVEEGQAGQSRPDFISKYSIALKEARESRYWLRLIIHSSRQPIEHSHALCNEAEEIARILAAIIIKAKGIKPGENRPDEKGEHPPE